MAPLKANDDDDIIFDLDLNRSGEVKHEEKDTSNTNRSMEDVKWELDSKQEEDDPMETNQSLEEVKQEENDVDYILPRHTTLGQVNFCF